MNLQPTFLFLTYLNLKITSAKKQNLKMCYLRHRLSIFLFDWKVMFHFQDIQVFVFLTIRYLPNL